MIKHFNGIKIKHSTAKTPYVKAHMTKGEVIALDHMQGFISVDKKEGLREYSALIPIFKKAHIKKLFRAVNQRLLSHGSLPPEDHAVYEKAEKKHKKQRYYFEPLAERKAEKLGRLPDKHLVLLPKCIAEFFISINPNTSINPKTGYLEFGRGDTGGGLREGPGQGGHSRPGGLRISTSEGTVTHAPVGVGGGRSEGGGGAEGEAEMRAGASFNREQERQEAANGLIGAIQGLDRRIRNIGDRIEDFNAKSEMITQRDALQRELESSMVPAPVAPLNRTEKQNAAFNNGYSYNPATNSFEFKGIPDKREYGSPYLANISAPVATGLQMAATLAGFMYGGPFGAAVANTLGHLTTGKTAESSVKSGLETLGEAGKLAGGFGFNPLVNQMIDSSLGKIIKGWEHRKNVRNWTEGRLHQEDKSTSFNPNLNPYAPKEEETSYNGFMPSRSYGSSYGYPTSVTSKESNAPPKGNQVPFPNANEYRSYDVPTPPWIQQQQQQKEPPAILKAIPAPAFVPSIPMKQPVPEIRISSAANPLLSKEQQHEAVTEYRQHHPRVEGDLFRRSDQLDESQKREAYTEYYKTHNRPHQPKEEMQEAVFSKKGGKIKKKKQTRSLDRLYFETRRFR